MAKSEKFTLFLDNVPQPGDIHWRMPDDFRGGTITITRANANEERDMETAAEERAEQIQSLREQYHAAETAEEYNAVWVAGDELGLREGGRVTIPALQTKRSAKEQKPEGPEDTLGRQVRVVKDADVSLRQLDAGARLQGHAAKFNVETVIGFFFKFREKIAPGAFTKTIQEADVRHLFNHDPTWVLGRNRSGTLTLREDSIGLFYDVDLNQDDPQALSVAEKVRRGDVNQSSFAFIVLRELFEENEDDDELPLRTLLEVKLFDTSTVTYPAYEDTTALIASGVRGAALTHLGLTAEVAEAIATERFTPDHADALRMVAQQAEELAVRCEDGEPCSEAAEEAPQTESADDRAAEEAPDGTTEGTDRDNEELDGLLSEVDRITRALSLGGLSSEDRKSLRSKDRDLRKRIAEISIQQEVNE